MATTTMRRDLRHDRLMWFLRFLQFILMLCALGVAGNAAHVWSSKYGCNVPTRTAWNIACASLTLFFLLYLIPTTGPLSLTKLWNRWVQTGFDALFIVFWIAAAATTQATCSDLCNACSVYYNILSEFPVWAGSVSCICSPGLVETLSSKRGLDDMLMSRAISSSDVKSGGKLIESTASIVAKMGFAGALVILFIVTFLYGLCKIYGDRQAAKAAQTQQPKAEGLKRQQTEYKSEPMVTEARV